MHISIFYLTRDHEFNKKTAISKLSSTVHTSPTSLLPMPCYCAGFNILCSHLLSLLINMALGKFRSFLMTPLTVVKFGRF